MNKNIDWCKDTIPALYTLNKMIVARDGNIPVKTILFIGDEADINFVIEKEGDLLNGIRYKNVDINRNHIKIEVPPNLAKFDYGKFIRLLGFDDAKVLDSLDEARGNILQAAIKENINDTASKILFKHFENFDDNILHMEDLKCLIADIVVETPSSEPAFEKSEPDSTAKNTSLESDAILETDSIPVLESTPEENVDTNDVLSNVPEPEVDTNEDLPYQIKDVLSEEEQAFNKELLDGIREQYNETIKYIQELHNGSYQIILNTMKECNEKSKYNKQFTLLYLEISSDNKTKLYKKLYDLDNYTKAFNEKLIHQVVEIGCPYCGHRWKEDITFVPAGQQFIQCPNCSEERPFIK